jgi:hypothetical protein
VTEPRTTGQAIAQITRRAAEIIQERGKAHYVFEDPDGKVCALGALCIAQNEATLNGWYLQPSRLNKLDYEVRNRVNAAVKRITRGLSIPVWSDNPNTTEEDIAKVFLQVADEAEVKG